MIHIGMSLQTSSKLQNMNSSHTCSTWQYGDLHDLISPSIPQLQGGIMAIKVLIFDLLDKKTENFVCIIQFHAFFSTSIYELLSYDKQFI